MNILIFLAIVCMLWGVTASILIIQDVQKRGIPVNFVWIRLTFFKVLGQYREATLAETGRVGALFYHFVVPMNLALLLVILRELSA